MNNYLTHRYKEIIKVLLIICFIYLLNEMVAIGEYTVRIPNASSGSFIIFEAELNAPAVITDIEITEEYLFFAYSTDGVVAVYDRSGSYQFSISFYDDTNGALGIGTANGVLYVSDHESNEFLFSGKDLLALHAPSEREYRVGWYHAATELPLRIENGKIYDEAGGYIMELPGKLQINGKYIPLYLILFPFILYFYNRSRKLHANNSK